MTEPPISTTISSEHNVNTKEPYLGPFTEEPEYSLKENNTWIIGGYRIDYTPKDCLKSLYYRIDCHDNQTFNIYTELIPGFAMFPLPYYWSLYRIHFLFDILLFIISIRPFISASAHTFASVSKKYYNRFWKCDHVSIVYATLASTINFSACIFCCKKINSGQFWMAVYSSFGFALALTIVIGYSDKIFVREYCIIILFAFGYYGPFIYGSYIYCNQTNDHYHWIQFYMYWKYSVIASFIAVLFRMFKYPEKIIWKLKLNSKVNRNVCHQLKQILEPRLEQRYKLVNEEHWCDYYATSHQIWHTFINISVFCQLLSWSHYYVYNNIANDPCVM
eukprot:11483_1